MHNNNNGGGRTSNGWEGRGCSRLSAARRLYIYICVDYIILYIIIIIHIIYSDRKSGGGGGTNNNGTRVSDAKPTIIYIYK